MPWRRRPQQRGGRHLAAHRRLSKTRRWRWRSRSTKARATACTSAWACASRPRSGLGHHAGRAAVPRAEGGRAPGHAAAVARLRRAAHPRRHLDHHRRVAAGAGPAAPGRHRAGDRSAHQRHRCPGPGLRPALTGLQLPGAATPRDMRVSANGAGELDDALLDLVMSLVKAQADAALADPALVAVAGLLGLRSGDAVPDFPHHHPAHARRAGAGRLGARHPGRRSQPRRLDRPPAALLHGTPHGDAIEFSLGGAAVLTLSCASPTAERQPAAHAQPRHRTGNDAARRGACRPVPHRSRQRRSLRAASLACGRRGRSGSPILDLTNPIVAHADTLRLGFGLDAQRRELRARRRHRAPRHARVRHAGPDLARRGDGCGRQHGGSRRQRVARGLGDAPAWRASWSASIRRYAASRPSRWLR